MEEKIEYDDWVGVVDVGVVVNGGFVDVEVYVFGVDWDEIVF